MNDLFIYVIVEIVRSLRNIATSSFKLCKCAVNVIKISAMNPCCIGDIFDDISCSQLGNMETELVTFELQMFLIPLRRPATLRRLPLQMPT